MLRGVQHLQEPVLIDLVAGHDMYAGSDRRVRRNVGSPLTEEHDGREARSAGQFLRPRETAAAGPLVSQQYGIKALGQKLGGELALQHRVAHDQLRLGPP